LKLLDTIKDGHVLFMSATPIYGNYQEIPNLVRLIKPGFVCYGPLTPDKLEEIMKGHLSYYGLNPPDTMVNFIGSSIPGIKTFKIFDIPMKKEQLCYYKKLEHDEKKITNIGINHAKATLGLINIKHDSYKKKMFICRKE